uniref:B30.2/SPRY domain-containing protein n=1 Tax=Salarias fasciatus TaxID=181472 RepID=A0A672GF82_SALFA
PTCFRVKFPVILDPNTAHHNLSISPDLSSVQRGRKKVLPDNPERCTGQMCVLGAAGFKSGKHSWTTEVGHTKDWSIGVALESFKRKNFVSLKPSEGIWAVSLCNGDSLFAKTCPRSKLPMKHKPEKITVELDYDKGRVVFRNATDSTTIYAFKAKFTERIFPYFSLGFPDGSQNESKLTISPMRIKVEVE